MMSIPRRAVRGTLVAAGALSAFLVATSVSSLRDADPGSQPTQAVIVAPPPAKQPPKGFDSRLRERVAAFRQARESADDMSQVAAGIAEVPVGLAVNRSRRLAPPQAAGRLWATPTSDGVCLNPLPRGAQGVAASCSTTEQVLAGDAVAATVYAEDNIDINGLVPDDVKGVRLVFPDGTTQAVEVGDNAYSVHVSRAPSSIVLVRSDGSELAVESPYAGG